MHFGRACSYLVSLVLIAFAFAACDPAPARVLNQDEKRADMLWLFAMLDQNYAPRELKEARADISPKVRCHATSSTISTECRGSICRMSI